MITQSLSQLHTDSAAGIQAQPACLCAVSGQARAPLSEALAAMHDNRENRLLGAALTQNTTGGAAIILRRKYSYSLPSAAGLVSDVPRGECISISGVKSTLPFIGRLHGNGN